jgi:hypothetical protein
MQMQDARAAILEKNLRQLNYPKCGFKNSRAKNANPGIVV